MVNLYFAHNETFESTHIRVFVIVPNVILYQLRLAMYFIELVSIFHKLETAQNLK